MEHNEIMNQARKMFLANKGRRDVITFFKMKGVAEAEAETMATDAYKSIREIRQAMMAEAKSQDGNTSTSSYAPTPVEKNSSGAIISLVFGLLICFGGIAASMGTDRIFYGAVILGGMMFFKGIVGLAN